MNISPAKAVLTYCNERGGCGIQEVNDKCYAIASAWNDNCNAFDIPSNLNKECENLVNQARINTYGVGVCDHQAPNKPLLLRENHFFPYLYKKNNNIPNSLALCYNRCETSNEPLECKQNCLLDSYALTQTQISLPSLKENFTYNETYTTSYFIFFLFLVLIFITYLNYSNKK